MNNTSDSNVTELKIDNTLWATPAKIINLLYFKPEKLSIKTESNDNIDIKVHQVRYENGSFCLTIDNIKGYFNFINNINVLSMMLKKFLMMIKKINIIKYGKKFLKLYALKN